MYALGNAQLNIKVEILIIRNEDIRKSTGSNSINVM